MKLILLAIILLGLIACDFQSNNSHSSDGLRYGTTNLPAGSSAEFIAAYDVLVRKCANCHKGRHASWTGLTTEAQWQVNDNGAVLVTTGSLANSAVITRLSLYWPGGDMPEAPDTALTTTEYNAIKTWIEGL